MPDPRSPTPAISRRHERAPGAWLLVLVVCALSVIPRLYVAARDPLNYDEYWHLFVARQDTPDGFAMEWRATAHPPLYYLFLRGIMSLGRKPLVERALSIVAGVGAVLLVGRILRMLAHHRSVPVVGALAFALAPSAVVLSAEVRSYMVCTCFVLLAFYHYLAVLHRHCAQPLAHALLFSLFSCLALGTHYYTVFFLAACGLALAGAGTQAHVCRNELGAFLRTRGLPLALAWLPIFGTLAVLYREHLSHGWRFALVHVSRFYHRPDSGESIGSYLVRALSNALTMFSPVPLDWLPPAALVALGLALVGACLLHLGRICTRTRESLRWVPLSCLLLIAGAMLVASLRGAYPFGGDLRQQFISFRSW